MMRCVVFFGNFYYNCGAINVCKVFFYFITSKKTMKNHLKSIAKFRHGKGLDGERGLTQMTFEL
jgi:hypothetical protein